jgi:hypothetical protein
MIGSRRTWTVANSEPAHAVGGHGAFRAFSFSYRPRSERAKRAERGPNQSKLS